MQFQTIQQWQTHVQEHWSTLVTQAEALKLDNQYKVLLAVSLLPVFPQTVAEVAPLLTLLHTEKVGTALSETLTRHFSEEPPPTFTQFIDTVYRLIAHEPEKQDDVDRLILRTGALSGAQLQTKTAGQFRKQLLHYFQHTDRRPSAIHVHAKTLSAGKNVVIAGRDVHFISEYYQGDRAALKNYLAEVRAEWNFPDLGSVLPEANTNFNNLVRLHHLYTPLDVWSDEHYQKATDEQLTELRFRAIEQDLTLFRSSALEAAAIEPLLVVTGAAGTGKSTLCRFLATCLAYACDPESEAQDGVSGLDMLGSVWVHGAILPLYVNLRSFCADAETFPKSEETATAKCLLRYLRQRADTFAPHLEKYLTNKQLPIHGALLLLDGLDEIYEERDRVIVKKIIENWANNYPNCRILVTSRNYAYRKGSRWRLSKRFKVVELAPYTWRQMQTYIHNWYSMSALLRPVHFGGREFAEVQAQQLAKSLVATILQSPNLWSLARQPLLLTLVVLIHEDNKKLPDSRAELYEKTVQLLHNWNPLHADDPLTKRLSHLNLDKVRLSLQLIAFDLQQRHALFQKYPSSIQRSELMEKLLEQHRASSGLGASVDDVLEYLGSRNGILVSEKSNTYRFLHMSIQEYLAACALLEQYDECKMPPKPAPQEQGDTWSFPDNISALLNADPYRWRDVALFIGAILAINKGQNNRWNYIEELLPDEYSPELSEGAMYSVYIAAEVWAERWLKVRLRSHIHIRQHLIACLEGITMNDGLDAPERARAVTILAQLQTDD